MTPEKQLIDYDIRLLAPGEVQIVKFVLSKEMFSLITKDEHCITEPGKFILMVGGDSRDKELLSVTITLS
jgi:hypothetical protein